MAWERGEASGKEESGLVGQRSLDHTAEELMQHSEEGQGSSAHAPPTAHAGGALLRAELRAGSGQVRGAGTGLPEARQQPTLQPFFPALQAGVCRWQGRRRGAHDLGVRGEVARQRGQGLGETEKRPLAPLYMGGSLQRTISRSLR